MEKHGHFRGCSLDKNCRCEIKRYWVIALITLITLLIEVIGGYHSNSLSLSSDAIHVFVDLASILLALVIEYQAMGAKDFSDEMSEHSRNRVRGWGGILSSALLFLVLVPISTEAAERIKSPEILYSQSMLIFSMAGLAGNIIAMRLMHQSHEDHITHVSLAAHIASDLIQSVGVVIGGIIVLLTNLYIVDT